MDERTGDTGGGDADYGVIAPVYGRYRVPDPRIASRILASLGDARHVLNVGAGTGSYEPTDRAVTAVEPSPEMRARRPAHLPIPIDAVAEHLPFPDDSFDASMATFSVHQWPDLGAGLREMRRVTRGPVLVLTCDPDLLDRFWLHDYAPEVLAVEARRYPCVQTIAAALGPSSEVIAVPIPLDCSDGFQEAYYGRPERFLDPDARLACSAWSFVAATVAGRMERDLGRDLRTGGVGRAAWPATHAAGVRRIASPHRRSTVTLPPE